MNYKAMHRSSPRQATIKVGLLAASVFFLAHFAFGKPKLPENATGKPSSDSTQVQQKREQSPASVFGQLSFESRNFLGETLLRRVNSSDRLPKNTAISMDEVINILAQWAPRLANNPNLAATLESGIKAMEGWLMPGMEIYELKARNLRKAAAVLRALEEFPDEQKQLISEMEKISKTYLGLLE